MIDEKTNSPGDELKEKILAFAPLVVSLVLLINTFLSAKGLPCIGLTDNDITTLISSIATVVSVIYTWWYNNNVSPNAQTSQVVLDVMNKGYLSREKVLMFVEENMTSGEDNE